MIRVITPQPHGSRWTKEEVDFLEESIHNNNSIEEIAKTISLRTHGAILTKANSLGYGNYHNKDDDLVYFKNDIKHRKGIKERGRDPKVYKPTDSKETADLHTKLSACIIPKTAPSIAYIDEIITLVQEIISPHLTIIDKLEAIKSLPWEH